MYIHAIVSIQFTCSITIYKKNTRIKLRKVFDSHKIMWQTLWTICNMWIRLKDEHQTKIKCFNECLVFLYFNRTSTYIYRKILCSHDLKFYTANIRIAWNWRKFFVSCVWENSWILDMLNTIRQMQMHTQSSYENYLICELKQKLPP